MTYYLLLLIILSSLTTEKTYLEYLMTELIITSETLTELLKKQHANTVVVTDDFNSDVVQAICDVVLQRGDVLQRAWEVKRILAVGGCTARDWAALLAHQHGLWWSYIPSVLSTDCISIDKAIIYEGDVHRVINVCCPKQVTVSFPLLRSNGEQSLRDWCAAGVGDLLSRISALIDERHGFEWLNPFEYANCDGRAQHAALGLTILQKISQLTWNDENLSLLASLLHGSSLNAKALSVCGEHDLYYQLRGRAGYRPALQKHGLVVSVGTLMSAWAYSQLGGNDELEKRLRRAYQAVGLPTTIPELQTHGIEADHILDAMHNIPPNSFLSESFSRHGDSLLLECYSKKA